MKKLFSMILVLGLLFSSEVYAASQFDKDLKKVSKNSSFIDRKGKAYAVEKITDKKNTILIIYTHGSINDQKIDKCLAGENKVPPVIRNLHDQKIKKFSIKIYRLCSGVRGWSEKEQNKMWKAYEKSGTLDLSLSDKKGNFLIKKQKQNQKLKIIKEKIDSFAEQGFGNIVLAGHSSGGWQSFKIKTNFPELIDGVIGLQPGAGGTVKNRKEWPWWEDIRYYGFGNTSKLNAIIITHDKDEFNAPKDYLLFSNSSNVKFVNLTKSDCKPNHKEGGYHAIVLHKCYAALDLKNNDIIKYIESLF